ncbi:MAG: cytosine permease [Clostridiales bacterium]
MADEKIEKRGSMSADDYADVPVPKDERVTWPQLTYVWFGAAMFVGLYYAGVELGTTMGKLSNAIIAITVGCLFLGTFVALNGIIGYRTGCNAALAGTYAYGSKGVFVPGFHIADIGWYIMMTAQFAAILHTLFPVIDARVFTIIFSMLFVTNGFIGFKQMARLNKVAMPILLFTGLYGVLRIHLITGGGLAEIFAREFPYTTPMATAITVVVGTWVSGSSRAADYFRWAKSPKDSIIASYVGFFFGLFICLMVGAMWGAGTGSTNIGTTLTMLGGGMMLFGVIMFFLQTWTTNEHSAYVTSTALPVAVKALTGEEKLKRRNVIVGVALLSVAVAGVGVEKYYIPFISFLGSIIPVIGASIIADYFIMSRTKYHWSGHKDFYSIPVNDEDVQHHKFNWAIVPSLILGTWIGLKATFFISSFNSLIGTIIIYCISTVIFSYLGLQKQEIAKNENLARERGVKA